jgi:hypothetical protein
MQCNAVQQCVMQCNAGRMPAATRPSGTPRLPPRRSCRCVVGRSLCTWRSFLKVALTDCLPSRDHPEWIIAQACPIRRAIRPYVCSTPRPARLMPRVQAGRCLGAADGICLSRGSPVPGTVIR